MFTLRISLIYKVILYQNLITKLSTSIRVPYFVIIFGKEMIKK